MSALATAICDRLGSTNLERAIEDFVSGLLAEAGEHSAPVSLESLFGRLRIHRFEQRSIPCDGMLVPLALGGYRVFVANWVSRTRQRFSLAHELGHAIIHELVPETRRFATRSVFMPPGHRAEERICDLIASRLLMPACAVVPWLKGKTLSLSTVRSFASHFDVSVSAAARRIGEALGCDFGLIQLAAFPSERTAVCEAALWTPKRVDRKCVVGRTFESPHILGQATCHPEHEGLGWIPVGPTCRAQFRWQSALLCGVGGDGFKKSMLAMYAPVGQSQSMNCIRL